MLKNILDDHFSKASFNCFFFSSPELCHMVEMRLIFSHRLTHSRNSSTQLLRCGSYIQPSPLSLVIWMNNCFSCFIYRIKLSAPQA